MGKIDALNRNSNRGIKLLDQVMKVCDRVIAQLIGNSIKLDEMQFGFVPRKSTAVVIFPLRQLQGKYLVKSKLLYLAFADLKKAFDRVPHSVIWGSLRKLRVVC